MIEYRSTDASAPVISGEVGKFNDALTAILVDGYGSKAAAGWSKPYASGSVAVFRQGAGKMRYMYSDDSGVRMVRIIGYVMMSSATTGTRPFPTNAQVGGGLYMRKSVTADTTARPWACWADAKTFYMVVFCAQTTPDGTSGGDAQIGFGDTVGAGFCDTFLICGTTSGETDTSAGNSRQVLSALSSNGGHYMPCMHTGVGRAISVLKTTPSYMASFFSGDTSLLGGVAYPEADGGLNLSRMFLVWTTAAPLANRGMLPGIWCVNHHIPGNMALYDTVSGAPGSSLEGREFVIIRSGYTSGGFAIETTPGSWDG